MIARDGQVRILDLGIGSILAHSEGESLVDTMSTANALTSGLDCASPESILEPTNRTPAGDQYSLGCVLYFCLTGRVPFPEGSAVEKMMAHQTKAPTPIRETSPDVPDELIAVVDRLMAKTSEERYPASSDVIGALRPLVSGRPGITAPPVAPPRQVEVRTPMKAGPVRSAPTATPAPRAAPQTERPASSPPTRETPERTNRTAPHPPSPTPRQTAPQIVPPSVPKPSRKEPVRAKAEEPIGTLGLFLCAVMATCLTWLISLWMFR